MFYTLRGLIWFEYFTDHCGCNIDFTGSGNKILGIGQPETHPQHDTGYYGPYMEEDKENITVEVYFGDELICQDSTQFHITEDISITELVK